MSIIQRYPYDKPGDEIVSSILKTPASQMERGLQEINFSSTDKIIKNCVLTIDEFVQPGELINLQNSEGVSTGMLTDYSIRVSNGVITSDITSEHVE